MTFGSLFAGIGGLDLGLERAGMECRWQVEIDDYARQVLAKHWPNVRRWDDVRTWPQPDTEQVDLICGGFPCQDISYAGLGAGLAGARSGLFYEVVRMVRSLRPRYVLLENVAALLTRGLDDVLGSLAAIGYDAEWHCIPAAAVGAPHIRDRVFIIGYRILDPYGKHDGALGSGAELQSVATACRGSSEQTAAADGTDTMRPRLSQRKGPPGQRTLSTITRSDWRAAEPDVGRVANGVPRRLDRLRCLGNAVVPQVAEYIGRQMMQAQVAEPAEE